MKKRFTEEQIAMALVQAEAGTPVAEICRKLQVTEQTFYRWKKKYGSLGTPEIRELRQLRDENKKLKQLVADLTLDKHILQQSLKKSFEHPGEAAVGRVGPAGLPAVPASRLPGQWVQPPDDSVSLLLPRARSFAPAHQGDCRRADQLRLPAASRAAAARGLADQPQASLPPV
jgi:putative transposase